VQLADGAQRQGLVIDVPKLVEYLTREIIAPSDLGSYATLRPLDASAPQIKTAATGGGEFIHRFAEPYGQLVLSLSLTGLPKSSSAAYVYSLGALLALAAALGMFAVYRMVSTTVAFAERRSNFVSAVTHELKTPLTAIRMYGEMLQEDLVADQSTRERYYRTITAETERLTRLVNNVLELSNLERNQRPMSLVVGRVGPVLREVESIVRPHVAEQEFELLLEVDDKLPAVQFERDALVQVLVNLVDNAIKYAYTAEDKRIHLVAKASPDGGVVLAVADHGPGVEDAQLRHIFEPFYRGQQELTRTAKGTGIGLSLVRSLVQRMNGSVDGRNTAPGFLVEIRLSAMRG
jgi:signal transduction histidine kinase